MVSGPAHTDVNSAAELGVQPVHGRGDDQRIHRRSRGQTEDLVEDVAMMAREPIDIPAQRVEQLVQRGEADLGLELHTGGAQHLRAGHLGPGRCRVQQCGLSDPRVAA
jgi:hypothetical protein